MERVHRRLAPGYLIGPDAAVLLAGGGARRLGGVDKAALVLDGQSLIDSVLAAVGDVPTVVVGPHRSTARSVLWASEDPPGGGPAAGIAAGIELLHHHWPQADTVAILAADLPGITADTLHRLAGALRESDASGAILTDPVGREQWLTGVWRMEAVAVALAARTNWAGASVRSLLTVPGLVFVDSVRWESVDIDTPADLRSWRRRQRDSGRQNGESGPAAGG